MNLTSIAVTVWMVLGWIGLVLLVVYTRRNRRALPERPSRHVTSRRVTSKRPSRQHRRARPYYWAG
jgi:beta-lactamase regulating signal transducer with metallopeptidase domain